MMSLKLVTESSLITNRSISKQKSVNRRSPQKNQESEINIPADLRLNVNIQKELNGHFISNPRETPNIQISEGIASILKRTPGIQDNESQKTLFGKGATHLTGHAQETASQERLKEQWMNIQSGIDMARLTTNQYQIEFDRAAHDFRHSKLEEPYDGNQKRQEADNKQGQQKTEVDDSKEQPSKESMISLKEEGIKETQQAQPGSQESKKNLEPNPKTSEPSNKPESSKIDARQRADRKYYFKIFSNYKEHRLQYTLKEYKQIQEAITEKCRVFCQDGEIDHHFKKLKVQNVERAIGADIKRRYDLQLRLLRLKAKGEADQENYAHGSRMKSSVEDSDSDGEVSAMGSEEFKNFNIDQHLRLKKEMQIGSNQIKRYRLLKKILDETRKVIKTDGAPDQEMVELIKRKNGILGAQDEPEIHSSEMDYIKFKTQVLGSRRGSLAVSGYSQSPKRPKVMLEDHQVFKLPPRSPGRQKRDTGASVLLSSLTEEYSKELKNSKDQSDKKQEQKQTKQQRIEQLRMQIKQNEVDQLKIVNEQNKCSHCGQHKNKVGGDQSDQSVNEMVHNQNEDFDDQGEQQVKLTEKQQALKDISSARGKIKDIKERNNDCVKVPIEFRTKFEMDQQMQPGSSMYSGREINDEIRIQYLIKQNDTIKEICEERINEHEIKMKGKIHSYGQSCVKIIQEELTDQFKHIFVQLDYLRHQQLQDQTIIEQQNQIIASQQQQVAQIRTYAKWDELAHEDFTIRLQIDGLKETDFYNLVENPVGIDQECREKRLEGLQEYYSKLYKCSEFEKDNLLLSQPFSLFNEHLRIGAFEKLNVMERETVNHYRKKLEVYEHESDVMSQNEEKSQKLYSEERIVEESSKLENTTKAESKVEVDKAPQQKKSKFILQIKQLEAQLRQKDIHMEQITDMLQKEKGRLVKRLNDLEQEVKLAKINQEQQFSSKQKELDSIKSILTRRVNELEKKAEEQERLHVQELKLKDTIILQQNASNAHQIQEIQRLEVMLKIPRFHNHHLLKNGKLEEFVDAKILGKDARAKWLLMSTAEVELDNIENKKRMEKKEKKKQKLLSQSFNTGSQSLSSDDCIDKSKYKTSNIFPNKKMIEAATYKKFIIHTSINSKKTRLKSNKGVFDVSFHEVPKSHIGYSRNANGNDDTLFQNSSNQNNLKNNVGPNSQLNSPNLRHLGMEQYSINSIVSQSNQNSMHQILQDNSQQKGGELQVGSTKQSSKFNSVNVSNLLNTARDQNQLIQVQNQQADQSQNLTKRQYEKSKRLHGNQIKDSRKNYSRQLLSLSISNAEDMDPQSFQREIISMRDSQNYQNIKTAQILNLSINSGIKFKSVFPKTTKNDQDVITIEQLQKSVQLPELKQAYQEQSYRQRRGGSPPDSKRMSVVSHGVKTLKVSNRPITQPKAQQTSYMRSTINNEIKEARIGMIRFSLDPNTQNKLNNDSQHYSSYGYPYDESRNNVPFKQDGPETLDHVLEYQKATSIYDQKMNEDNEKISQLSPETRGITSIDQNSQFKTATGIHAPIKSGGGGLSSAFSPTIKGSGENLLSETEHQNNATSSKLKMPQELNPFTPISMQPTLSNNNLAIQTYKNGNININENQLIEEQGRDSSYLHQ